MEIKTLKYPAGSFRLRDYALQKRKHTSAAETGHCSQLRNKLNVVSQDQLCVHQLFLAARRQTPQQFVSELLKHKKRICQRSQMWKKAYFFCQSQNSQQLKCNILFWESQFTYAYTCFCTICIHQPQFIEYFMGIYFV